MKKPPREGQLMRATSPVAANRLREGKNKERILLRLDVLYVVLVGDALAVLSSAVVPAIRTHKECLLAATQNLHRLYYRVHLTLLDVDSALLRIAADAHPKVVPEEPGVHAALPPQ